MKHVHCTRRAGMHAGGLSALVLAAVLAGCGSAPPRAPGPGPVAVPPVTPRAGPAPASGRDGAEARPPADLALIPDAEPRVEALRRGGPNRPYEALGREYVPFTDDRPFRERGLASWYGTKFHGRRTASGETYNMYAMTAAHPTLPLPSYARVVNPANQREVIVRINDRGPFHRGRIVDLSYTAALKLGLLGGVRPVELTRITHEDIRTGAWRRGSVPEAPGGERGAVEVAAARAGAVADADDDPIASFTALRTRFDDAGGTVSSASVPDELAVTPMAKAPRGWWVQLGAFRQREGIESYARHIAAELDDLGAALGAYSDASGYRLQAGPYASRDEAQAAARRVRDALALVPVVVEKR